MGFGDRHHRNHQVLPRPRQNEARWLDGLSGPKLANGRLWEIGLLVSVLQPSLYPCPLLCNFASSLTKGKTGFPTYPLILGLALRLSLDNRMGEEVAQVQFWAKVLRDTTYFYFPSLVRLPSSWKQLPLGSYCPFNLGPRITPCGRH